MTEDSQDGAAKIQGGGESAGDSLKVNEYQNSLRKQFIDWITVVIFLFGAFTGYCAVREYKEQNLINKTNNALSMDSQLLNMERETYRTLEGKPYLQAFWAKCPKKADPVEFSYKAVDMFYWKYADSKNGSKKKKDNRHFEWKTIPELSEKLFAADSFNDQENERLREAYFLAEGFLYILENAFYAKEEKIVGKDDWDTWVGYFYDIGMHPMFLSAIYFGHKYAYIDESFAREIWERLKEKDSETHVLEKIYPDIVKEDWHKKVGKNKLD